MAHSALASSSMGRIAQVVLQLGCDRNGAGVSLASLMTPHVHPELVELNCRIVTDGAARTLGGGLGGLI